MKERIKEYLKAGYPGLYIVSAEETRVEQEVRKAVEELSTEHFSLMAWSLGRGLQTIVGDRKKKSTTAGDPITVLEVTMDEEQVPSNTIVLLRDYHLHFDEKPVEPLLLRGLKDAMYDGKRRGVCLAIVACRLTLPPELEREFTVLDFGLPGPDLLGTALDGVVKSAKQEPPENGLRERLLDSAAGLTCFEAESAYALSIVKTKGVLDPAIVAHEKAQAVKKSGLLELYEGPESLDDIGGMDVLKGWLIDRRRAFSKKAIAYRLPSPKGLLVTGIAGTGKSLTAKATGTAFGRPVLRLDAGRLFGGILGESESNVRAVQATAEAIAPCILWIENRFTLNCANCWDTLAA